MGSQDQSAGQPGRAFCLKRGMVSPGREQRRGTVGRGGAGAQQGLQLPGLGFQPHCAYLPALCMSPVAWRHLTQPCDPSTA